MSKLSFTGDPYTRFENTRGVPSYHAESTHPIKSEHGTSSQPINHIPTFPSQTYGGHESNDAYANNAFNNAQREQLLNTYSTQGPQLPPSSRTSQLSPFRQIPQFPSLPTPRTPRTQPSYLEATSGHTEGSPPYVNAKQFHRILKRRAARERLLRNTPGIRKPYIHERRHRHAMRRSRGPRGRFLTQDGLKRERKKVQNDTTDKSQTPKTKAGPNMSHVKKESVDWAAGISTKDEKGQQTLKATKSRTSEANTGIQQKGHLRSVKR